MCPPAPAKHHPELPLKVVMPELPAGAGSCHGKSRSPLAEACCGGAGPTGRCPRGGTLRSTPALWCREGIPALGWIAFALCLLENKICRGLRNTGAAAALPGVCHRRKKPHGEAGSCPAQEVPQPPPLRGDTARRLGWGIGSVLSGRAPRARAAPLAASGQAPRGRGGSSLASQPRAPATEGLCSRQRGCDCSHHRQVTVEMPNVEGQRQE